MKSKAEVVQIKARPAKGCFMYLDLDLPKHKEMLNGEYEAIFYENMVSTKGLVVWDVGAHMGYHSIALANMGADIVYSFEPGLEAMARLCSNLTLNQALPISIQFYALADFDGHDMLHSSDIVDSASSGNHLVCVPAPEDRYDGFKNRDVMVRKGDSLFPFIQMPDLIKVDIEGGELLFLAGINKIIQSKRPALIMEIHSYQLLKRCKNSLESYGYEFEILKEETPKRIFAKAMARSRL